MIYASESLCEDSSLSIDMPRIKCLTAQEAVNIILHEIDSDTGDVDLVNIPPDDDLSDEDEIDDSQLGEAVVADVPGTLEVHFGNEDEDSSPAPPKKKKKKTEPNEQNGPGVESNRPGIFFLG